MAIPTFISVTPVLGPVGGGNVLTINGTNFQLPAAQPATGPSVVQPPSVEVKIDGRNALFVDVISTTELTVAVPPFHGTPTDDPIPAVAIVISNLDLAGVVIPGETVTAAAAYTYRRPNIHDSAADPAAPQSPYTLVSAALITALRRQVISNVTQTTHVDYGEPGVVEITVSKIPALIIQGPTVMRDVVRWHSESIVVDNLNGTFSIKKPPFVAKMTYTLIGVTDNEREYMNLIGSVMECFERNKFLAVDVDLYNPAAGRVNLVLELTQQPQATSAPSESNIRTFAAVCEVRGVEVQEPEPVDRTYNSGTPELKVQETGSAVIENILIN
jgi:hypothetical protein